MLWWTCWPLASRPMWTQLWLSCVEPLAAASLVTPVSVDPTQFAGVLLCLTRSYLKHAGGNTTCSTVPRRSATYAWLVHSSALSNLECLRLQLEPSLAWGRAAHSAQLFVMLCRCTGGIGCTSGSSPAEPGGHTRHPGHLPQPRTLAGQSHRALSASGAWPLGEMLFSSAQLFVSPRLVLAARVPGDYHVHCMTSACPTLS